MRCAVCVLATLFALLLPGSVASLRAQERPYPSDSEQHTDVVVHGRAIKQVGEARSASQGTVGYQDFEDKPLGRVGELVENVPGVVATQHSGTGKANQYFLRGFNLDHGTDFAGFIDGAPINLRSHAHGQGYLDLNFLIPELVQRIDYRKGPYFADVGDFSAAGTVAFKTYDRLPTGIAKATVGEFGYYRALIAHNVDLGRGTLLFGVEGNVSDGPWVLDEKLRKGNALIKFSQGTPASGWNVALSAYHARWHATDQVPVRAITSGLISRFGNIDPFLGGDTTRIGITAQGHWGGLSIGGYATYYALRLTSNFTYFIDDPVNGDEFQQRDRRGVFGGSAKYAFDAGPVAFTVGGDTRFDDIGEIGLFHSIKGVRAAPIRQDKVGEYSGALFAEGQIALTPRLRAILGVRGDLYAYHVAARLAANGGSGSATFLGPKASLAWSPRKAIEFYANYGESFHSNDVRGATITVDPVSGAPAARVPVLARARGAELGGRVETGRFNISITGFYLTLASELVFTGDGGNTEPNAASRRFGVEANLFWRPTNWLTIDGSGALTRARFRGVPPGEDHIPNAVSQVVEGGAAFALGHGFTASLRLRHFGSAPLIEDNSARSRPTTLVNLGGYYRIHRFKLGVDILNLFNARDADITYFYASRLPGEPAQGVEDSHLHPVEPREVRVSLQSDF